MQLRPLVLLIFFLGSGCTRLPDLSEAPQPTSTPLVKPTAPTAPASVSPSPISSPPTVISPDSQPRLSENDFAWLSQRQVTTADLEGKSDFGLDVLRNSIFARYGRRFDRTDLQFYFDSQTWYEPRYSPSQFPNNLLTDLERSNAEFILNYQQTQ